MSSKKAISVLATSVLATVVLAGCGVGNSTSNNAGSSNSGQSSSSTASAKSTGDGKSYTMALVPGLTTDPFYITMNNGAQAEAKKLGVKLLFQGATAMTASDQLPVVNSLISQGVNALLVAPADANALTPPLKTAAQQGIKVVTVDTSVSDTSFLTAAVTSNNYQGGEAAADALAKASNGKGEVAVINFDKGVTTADARRAGFMAEIKKYPGMKVVADEYCNNSETTADSDVSSILLAHPNLVGVFGTNLYAAVGSGQAVKSSGKAGQVNVIAYDAEPEEIQDIKDGLIYGTVAQNPYQEGQLAVEYAYDSLTGKNTFPKSTQLENLVITKQNVNNSSTQNWIYATGSNN
ncbi:ABC transporter substrate-binding protein [Alicyclobacillus fastidiosus]|uniref:ABC transporter substrate-binding protein n=1 Tax=Alicyclobacillus fastidiosus TaxID=392011 RepID=A0ABY6ZDM9_9BACL|nr:ABC transporter substrate-binding protein [Alicyclobacillus fastidiosus]WAH40668.1 ABC transporter substrate-binding protein [Alicyclobacillus fastidiosus]GMA62130.1 sugar ABC transporter substrate-binding protein [Alicyclobacillus fastidiosus]